jgi:hypothetical protein
MSRDHSTNQPSLLETKAILCLQATYVLFQSAGEAFLRKATNDEFIHIIRSPIVDQASSVFTLEIDNVDYNIWHMRTPTAGTVHELQYAHFPVTFVASICMVLSPFSLPQIDNFANNQEQLRDWLVPEQALRLQQIIYAEISKKLPLLILQLHFSKQPAPIKDVLGENFEIPESSLYATCAINKENEFLAILSGFVEGF